jgi:hypothetical protein
MFWPRKLAISASVLGLIEIGGTPHGAAPPRPPGIRVTYHGGSTGLSLGRDIETGKTEGLEVVVAQGLLDRRVS